MYLDYSKLGASQIKQPALRLQTLAGKELEDFKTGSKSPAEPLIKSLGSATLILN